MMAKAIRFHGVRATFVVLILVVGLVVGLKIQADILEQRRKDRAAALVEQLRKADTANVPEIIADMVAYRPWVDPVLKEDFAQWSDGSKEKLHAALALLPVDPGMLDYVYSRLLNAQSLKTSQSCSAALLPTSRNYCPKSKLPVLAAACKMAKESQRLRAASALAVFNADSLAWPKVGDELTRDLTREPTVHLQSWIESLRPVRSQLVRPLAAAIFRDFGPERKRSCTGG